MAQYDTILGFKVDLKSLDSLEKRLTDIESQLKKVGNETTNVSKTSSSSFKSIASGINVADIALGALTVTLSAAAIGFGFLLKNSMDAEREMALLTSVINSTGGTAGYSATQINALSESLSKASTVSTGEINEAAARMLTYTNIVGENFPKAMQIAIDWSARYGVSVVQATETIGKALDTPSKAASALSRQGFKFTKEFIDQLKSLEAAGKVAEAQALMMDQITEGTEGAAAALRDTFGGAVQNLQNRLGDLISGDTGSLDGLTSSINSIAELVSSPQVTDSFGKLIKQFTDFISEITKSVNSLIGANGLAHAIDAISSLFTAFRANIAAQFTVIFTYIDVLVTGLDGLAKAMRFDFAGAKESGNEMLTKLKSGLQGAKDEADKAQRAFNDVGKSIKAMWNGTARTTNVPTVNMTPGPTGTPSTGGNIDTTVDKAAAKAAEDAAKRFDRLKDKFDTDLKKIANDSAIAIFGEENLSQGGAMAAQFQAMSRAATTLGATLDINSTKLTSDGIQLGYNLERFQQINNLTDAQTAKFKEQIDLAVLQAQKDSTKLTTLQAENLANQQLIEGTRDLAAMADENLIRSQNLGMSEAKINELLAQARFDREQMVLHEQNLVNFGQEYADKIKAQNEELNKQRKVQEKEGKELEGKKSMVDDFKNIAIDGIGNAFDAMWDGQSVKFGDMLKDMAKQMIKSALMKMLTNLMGGNGFFGGGGAAPVAQADGGAWYKGVQMFANGGIVNRATPFGMANGGLGVMGEAGPEAILPLTRGKNGKLGVQTSGGGSNPINVSIGAGAVVVNASEDSNADAESTAAALRQLIDTRVNDILNDALRPGNALGRR